MLIVVHWMYWMASLWLVDLHILVYLGLMILSWIFSFRKTSLILIMMFLA
jgi:hypothetical protein